jgi:hypothetical protein
MPTAMIMRWPGITLDQYEQARERVDWEHDVPPGAIFHVVAQDGDELRVVDVWRTAEDFERFAAERLMPAVRELGIPGEPEVRLLDVHRSFAPDGIPAGAPAVV